MFVNTSILPSSSERTSTLRQPSFYISPCALIFHVRQLFRLLPPFLRRPLFRLRQLSRLRPLFRLGALFVLHPLIRPHPLFHLLPINFLRPLNPPFPLIQRRRLIGPRLCARLQPSLRPLALFYPLTCFLALLLTECRLKFLVQRKGFTHWQAAWPTIMFG